MKKYLNAILIVEGKEDVSYLSSYIASEIVVVNGFELSKETIAYLKDKETIALLDPDEAGQKIRQKINQELNKVINIDVDIRKCTRGTKNGIAECEISEILYKLEPFFVEKEQSVTTINNKDLYDLGILENKELREYVCKRLNLGKCNNKLFIKRLEFNKINLEALKTTVEYYKNGN